VNRGRVWPAGIFKENRNLSRIFQLMASSLDGKQQRRPGAAVALDVRPPLTRLNGPDARGHGSVGADQSRNKPWRVGKHHISLACKVHARGRWETSAGRVPGFFGSGRTRSSRPRVFFPRFRFRQRSAFDAASSGGQDKPSNPGLGHTTEALRNSIRERIGGVSNMVPAL
jgi:hypothetical protein